MSGTGSPSRAATRLLPLTITAVGVVYGDIGTSPLYAFRECFHGVLGVAPAPENVLGVLSLVLYSLFLLVTVKYVAVVLRADNHGEGGILALTALILPRETDPRRATVGAAARPALVALGIFGTALLYGDGMITPAISVLGAVEGLQVLTPALARYVVPVAVVVLGVLFAIQRYGTHRIGGLFGPVMVAWFVTIAVLGAAWIARAPAVLAAFDPSRGLAFLSTNGTAGFAVLGAVFLVVTGGEALYADMGHFGRKPIRLAWFALVLPALVVNYLGQGALLLIDPAAADSPFFLLAPAWARLPLVVLATSAAVIASQALISGSFSLTRQAIQLGYAPRLDVEHTSSLEIGQIYVPQVNWALMAATILIVIGFQSSGGIAAAYGIAVTTTMVITVLLLYVVMRERWQWPLPLALGVTAVFLVMDLAFFGANLLKIAQGGWLPLLIAVTLFTLMTTWKTGRRLVADRLAARAIPLERFLAALSADPPVRVRGTAVFMSAQPTGTPPALAHNLRFNKVLHEHIVVLTVRTTRTPYVLPKHRLSVRALGGGIFDVWAQYGFMEHPDVPEALAQARTLGVEIDPEDVTYFLGRETVVPARGTGMAAWRERLFSLMARNAVRAGRFFRLPPDRVVELGVQVEV